MRKMALVLGALGLLTFSAAPARAHETGKAHKHSKKKDKGADDKKDDAAKTEEVKPAEDKPAK